MERGRIRRSPGIDRAPTTSMMFLPVPLVAGLDGAGTIEVQADARLAGGDQGLHHLGHIAARQAVGGEIAEAHLDAGPHRGHVAQAQGDESHDPHRRTRKTGAHPDVAELEGAEQEQAPDDEDYDEQYCQPRLGIPEDFIHGFRPCSARSEPPFRSMPPAIPGKS